MYVLYTTAMLSTAVIEVSHIGLGPDIWIDCRHISGINDIEAGLKSYSVRSLYLVFDAISGSG